MTLENIVRFFKKSQITATVNPEIEVSYHSWGFSNKDIELALKKEWEAMRKEISSDPNVTIISDKWNDYYQGNKQEEVSVEMDGVRMTLKGPYYPDPDWEKNHPKQVDNRTIEQRANELIDQMLGTQQGMIWGLTHCSDDKFNTLIEFMRATRRSGMKDS